MGLFSKKSKVNPKISTQGIDILFDLDFEIWEFSYRGIDFVSFEKDLALPTIAQLDEIRSTIESLQPEINSRIENGLEEWCEGAKINSGERCLINISDFVSDREFTACYSEGANWGDVGVDLTIIDQEIIDDSWSD